MHGLAQKVGDAASGAKAMAEETGAAVADVTSAMMAKAADAILSGEWSQCGAASGVEEATLVARSITRAAIKAQLGAKSEKWAEFTGLSDADQAAKLDANFAKNEAKPRPR